MTNNTAFYFINGQVEVGPYSLTDYLRLRITDPSLPELLENSKYCEVVCLDRESFGIWLNARRAKEQLHNDLDSLAYWHSSLDIVKVSSKFKLPIAELEAKIKKDLPLMKTQLMLMGITFPE